MNLKKKRIAATVIGVCMSGVSVGFFKYAALGVDPFQCTMSGLDAAFSISFGTLYVIANLVLLSFSLIFDRHYIGLGTFINLFLLGYIADFCHHVLVASLPDQLILRLISLAIGLLMNCIASAFYMTADMGVSTYDAIALVMANKWKVAEFRFCRIATDLGCIVIGCFLMAVAGAGKAGILANVNVGTIITAFCMGPLIAFFRKKFAEPIIGK